MYHRCLVCNREFEANEALEHLARGRRVAYDPEKGRLWVICPSCRRWSLVPIEERWEALEELEKAVTDGSRLLSQTDNVALLKAGPMEIVRVGRAALREEAWWRYGRELRDRRARFKKLSAAGTLGAGAALAGSWATGGMSFVAAWFLWDQSPAAVVNGARWLRFGSRAWSGRGACQVCGRPFDTVRFSERSRLIFSQQDGAPRVTITCPGCGEFRNGGLHLSGQEGNRVIRKVLAYHHFSGASERKVAEATRLIEVAGGPEALPSKILKQEIRLGGLTRRAAIALEIASNEQQERRLLELKLAELESHWRREEELAEIIDGELTPLPFLETLRRKVTGSS